MSGPRIAVAGAGIGGLALAAALGRTGTPCTVYEQTRRLAEVGAGVQLAPNAVRPLLRLGLGPALRERAVRIEAMEVRGWNGRPIARTPYGSACERVFGAPYYAVHRAHLHEALWDAVVVGNLARGQTGEQESAGGVRLGRRLERVTESADDVTLAFGDGSTETADVVVGADGIHSVVREALVRDVPVFAGLGVYRGLVRVDRLPPAARSPLVRLWLGPGGHFVCYPVSGGEQISFAATTALSDPPAESWTSVGDPDGLVRAFGGWSGLVSDVVRAAGPVGHWALHDREPLETWSTRRLTVLGDAAHPMLPFMAQGANQAVEDAVDLAALLAGASEADVAARLARYQAVRSARTAGIQQGSRANAGVLHLPDGPDQQARDAAMRSGAGLRHRAAHFGYEAGGDRFRNGVRSVTRETRDGRETTRTERDRLTRVSTVSGST